MSLVIVGSLFPAATRTAGPGADYWWTRDLFHLRFQADPPVLAGALVVAAIALMAHLHLAGIRAGEAAHRRAGLLLAAQGCAFGALFSADVVALLFFLDAMLVCLWLLARSAAPRGADRLLSIAYAGSLLLGAGLAVLWVQAGDSSTLSLGLLLLSQEPTRLKGAAALLLLGLAPRLGAFPGHGWVPSLSPAGPGIAGVCVALLAPVGAVVLLRLLPGSIMLPTVPGFSGLAFALGLVAVLWGAVRVWAAADLRGLAAWLTVVQAGHLLCALGAAAAPMGSPGALRAAAVQVLAAPVALVCVWTVASAVAARAGSDTYAGVSGLWRRMPGAGLVLLAGGLSLAGLPPLAGWWVQRGLLAGVWGVGHPVWAVLIGLADLVVALSVVNAFRLIFLRREPPPPVSESSAWLSLQVALPALALVVLGVWPALVTGWGAQVLSGGVTGVP